MFQLYVTTGDKSFPSGSATLGLLITSFHTYNMYTFTNTLMQSLIFTRSYFVQFPKEFHSEQKTHTKFLQHNNLQDSLNFYILSTVSPSQGLRENPTHEQIQNTCSCKSQEIYLKLTNTHFTRSSHLSSAFTKQFNGLCLLLTNISEI